MPACCLVGFHEIDILSSSAYIITIIIIIMIKMIKVTIMIIISAVISCYLPALTTRWLGLVIIMKPPNLISGDLIALTRVGPLPSSL